MNLKKGTLCQVIKDHPHHPYRWGRFCFMGSNEVIVLADLDETHMQFAVGKYDIKDFNPDVDKVIVEDQNSP